MGNYEPYREPKPLLKITQIAGEPIRMDDITLVDIDPDIETIRSALTALEQETRFIGLGQLALAALSRLEVRVPPKGQP